ncbi:VWA domain-containing protein, partial [Candidatus Woesearchaeota archaeon]|nr:VWA domain-containing protein [Candidatus Woesearchaeota archaeon]
KLEFKEIDRRDIFFLAVICILAASVFIFAQPLNETITSGYHNITAKITPLSGNDYFKENNEFYKTTHVVPKPKVLFVTKMPSSLKSILDELYETTQASSIPASKGELEKYYAVILNDLSASDVRDIGALQDFVIEGGGLFVIGGYNSFDNGQYKGSAIETLLPVTVGVGKKDRGNSNVVIVIDISGSTGFEYGQAERAVDVEKALAISVIDDMNEGNRVGVVAFNSQAYKVADIEPLFVQKAEVKDKISKLVDSGYTVLNVGLRGAFELLQGKTGSKNVVWITDGVTLDPIDLQQTASIAQAMHEYGIKLFTIGVGRNANEEYLSDIGKIGDGFYVKATDSHRLKILFGEPRQKKAGSAFDLFILNSNHFITEDLELDAVLYGYNQIIPRQSAQLLITTDSGVPAVTVWRHGIGRVAALTVFSSGNNLGELLEERNSRVLTRIVNWAIGDPERKNPFFVRVDDARVNESSRVFVKAGAFPIVSGLVFSKIDKDTYAANLKNDRVGIFGVLHASYGVNYHQEYETLGFNAQFKSTVRSTGGKVFKPSEVEDIIEHIKNVSKRSVIEQVSFRFEFLLAALAILLVEMIVRRIRDNWSR